MARANQGFGRADFKREPHLTYGRTYDTPLFLTDAYRACGAAAYYSVYHR